MNINLTRMEIVISEQGIKGFCHGSEGSPLWILKKYPVQLHKQIEKYLKQINSGNKNPVIEFKGEHEHNLDFVRAVKMYAENPDWM